MFQAECTFRPKGGNKGGEKYIICVEYPTSPNFNEEASLFCAQQSCKRIATKFLPAEINKLLAPL